MSLTSSNHFRLSQLESDELQRVMRSWTPHELYNFSTISKKTKEMAKSLKKKPSTIKLCCHPSCAIEISFSKEYKDTWRFEVVNNSEEASRNEFRYQYLPLISETPLPTFFKLVEHVREVFNCSIFEIGFYSYSIPCENLLPIIDWVNNCQKIEEVSKIHVVYGPGRNVLKIVLENFKKSFKELRIDGGDYTGDRIFIPETLKLEDIADFSSGKWTTVDNLFAIDSTAIYIENCPLNNEDLNKFLRSWQEGKTNSRMRMCDLHTPDKVDWKVALDGLSPKIRHPRTTKRSFIYGAQKTFYIHGGIDIQRNDGKIATIHLLCHLTEDENEPIPDSFIRKYEKVVKDLNQEGDDVSVELDDWEVSEGMAELEGVVAEKKYEYHYEDDSEDDYGLSLIVW